MPPVPPPLPPLPVPPGNPPAPDALIVPFPATVMMLEDDETPVMCSGSLIAPDIVLVADKTGRNIADVSRTFLAVVRYFRLERIVDAAREIGAADYFDRLALDRARDSLARAARQLTAEVLKGGAGVEAMDAWVKPRAGEVERIRTSMHEIADTGLTLSKLSVAASLLGDLAGR